MKSSIFYIIMVVYYPFIFILISQSFFVSISVIQPDQVNVRHIANISLFLFKTISFQVWVCRYDFVSEMDPTLTNKIFEQVNNLNNWTQSLQFCYGVDTVTDLSSAIGYYAETPKDVDSYQPKLYPNGTVYRFDPQHYRGASVWKTLRENIFKSCIGCSMCEIRTQKKSSIRELGFDLACNRSLKQPETNPNLFAVGDDDCMAKIGIKQEKVKRQKTSGERKGIDRMDKPIKISQSARMAKMKTYSENQPEFRRTKSSRPATDDTKCKMKLSVFMDRSGYWYLSKNGCLQHNDHSYIDQNVQTVREKDVNKEGITLMSALATAGVSPAKIAEVMEHFLDGGEMLTKTVENMTKKMEIAREILQGVTEDMSTAEKAIHYLKR